LGFFVFRALVAGRAAEMVLVALDRRKESVRPEPTTKREDQRR
jgi:hypothetical protein